MGYTTKFTGQLNLNKTLSVKALRFLELLNNTRRMGRKNIDDAFGIQGEFFVFEDPNSKQYIKDFFPGIEIPNPTIIDFNRPPSTQPGLWCQWRPTKNGNAIKWDGKDKFYNYTEWLVYIIHKILKPNGYVLNGKLKYKGEWKGDYGEIEVKDNHVFLNGEEQFPTPEMRTDVVMIFS